MDPHEIMRTLRKLGVRPSKSLGQHFLLDESIASRQVWLSEPHEGETALEIGPGLGILTSPLLEGFGRVIAVEKDRRLCSFLRDRFPQLDLIEGDALQVEIPPFDKVVSNLPYEISSPMTFRLLDMGFQRGVLMYQREFAERLTSSQGEKGYSRLSVIVSYRASARIVEIVPKEKFFPEPGIDSAIVELIPRKPPYEVESERIFLDLVNLLFMHRRKKIANSILLGWKRFFPSKEEARLFLQRSEWSDKRVDELSPDEIAAISNEIPTKD